MSTLLFFLIAVGLIFLAFGLGVMLSRMTREREDQDVTGQMGRGHAPAQYRRPPPRPSQLEIFHREYVRKGWMLPTDNDKAEDERRLSIYDKFLRGMTDDV